MPSLAITENTTTLPRLTLPTGGQVNFYINNCGDFRSLRRLRFLRREKGVPGLAFRLIVKEPLMVILPSDHHLAALKAVGRRDLVGETFVIVSGTAPVLRAVINLKRSRIDITPAHEADNVTMGLSLIVSTRGVDSYLLTHRTFSLRL